MAKPIQITIPEPCSQPWEEMTPCGQGRFCGHCQKTVIDFSTWSDAALYDFISKKTERVCGRFLPSQLNRNINIPPQPHSRLYRLTIALGLTLIFAQGTSVYAQNKPPLTTQTIPSSQQPYEYGKINGKILDNKKEPIINAALQLYQGDILKGGNITDFDGNYILGPLDPGYYDLHIICEGRTQMIVKRIVVAPSTTTTQNATINTTDTQTVVIPYKKPLLPNPNSDVIRPEDIKTLFTGEVVDMVGLNPGQYQSQRGKGTSIQGGARANGTLYIIDGVNVSENQPDKPDKKKKKRWHLFRKQP